MEHQSILPSGIETELEQQNNDLGDGNIGSASATGCMSPHGSRRRSISEVGMIAQQGLSNDGMINQRGTAKTPAIGIRAAEACNSMTASSTGASVFTDFCRGQPPRRSFLCPDGRTPPRFRVSRRSTLADRPELDTLLHAVTVQYKDEEFLPLDTNTVHHLAQYLNGSKPLVHTCRFKRLLINSDTNKVRVDLFVAALEDVGVFCEHLAIVAPFHVIEFSSVFDRETGNLDPGSDWEKILGCLPNLRTLTFEHPPTDFTTLTRDTFYTLNCALANNTTLQKYVKVQYDVPPKVMFDYHYDYHSRQRQSCSPRTFNTFPLTMVGGDMVYADGAVDYGLLDAEPIFGKADEIEKVDG